MENIEIQPNPFTEMHSLLKRGYAHLRQKLLVTEKQKVIFHGPLPRTELIVQISKGISQDNTLDQVILCENSIDTCR